MCRAGDRDLDGVAGGGSLNRLGVPIGAAIGLVLGFEECVRRIDNASVAMILWWKSS